MFERQTQKVAETRDHAVGFGRVLQDERGDRMERVEQEMGMKLHLQRRQSRLSKLGLKRCLFQLAVAEFSIVKKRMHSDDDEGGDYHIDVEAESEIRAV